MKSLICPLCSLTLVENSQGLACANRHQFDRAKEGYFNLLPVQHKNSREPGDAREQLQARRAFLQAGYFLPLVNEIVGLVDAKVQSLLDIGCGEGYFTKALASHCAVAEVYGLDIAKAGVRMAAKSGSHNITYLVGSSYALPLADNSQDLITRIYAPSKDEELSRVLRDEGHLLIVTPGPQHLLGIRKKLYQNIRPHPQPVAPAGFVRAAESSLVYPLMIPAGDMAQALLQMTPFAWKLTPELSASYVAEGIDDVADFHINIYKKA